jgi:hypothetical protein
MNIKQTINKYEELDFEPLTAEMQALYWYIMHCSNNAGIIYLSPNVVKKKLNLPNSEYAQRLIDRFCDEYPQCIKGNVQYLYLLTSKILDQHNTPLNTNYTRHIGVLKDLSESHTSFTDIGAYEMFFDEYVKEAYLTYLANIQGRMQNESAFL